MSKPIRLSKKQIRALALLCDGETYKSTASKLKYTDPNAVNMLMRTAKRNNNCSSTLQLAIKAERAGLLK